MTIPQSRMRKLQLLRRSIRRGDFGRAAEILDSGGGAGGEGKHAAAEPLPLEQACGGAEQTVATPTGEAKYWLIRRTLGQIAPDDVSIAAEFASVLRGARQRFDELKASPALCHVADALPEDLLFMDLETCGLAGTPIFLVGELAWAADELVFTQRLARDYSEEPAICAAFAERLAGASVLVTFNGKAFDMTMLRERSAFHAVAFPPRDELPPHLDLLHESRRQWRGQVANHRLQTLERHFCGRARVGDIPGWAIPDAYHKFVDTHDARGIGDIAHHNVLDLLTMAQLLVAILTGCGDRDG